MPACFSEQGGSHRRGGASAPQTNGDFSNGCQESTGREKAGRQSKNKNTPSSSRRSKSSKTLGRECTNCCWPHPRGREFIFAFETAEQSTRTIGDRVSSRNVSFIGRTSRGLRNAAITPKARHHAHPLIASRAPTLPTKSGLIQINMSHCISDSVF